MGRRTFTRFMASDEALIDITTLTNHQGAVAKTSVRSCFRMGKAPPKLSF